MTKKVWLSILLVAILVIGLSSLLHAGEELKSIYEIAGEDGVYYGSHIQLENLGGEPETLVLYYYKGDHHWGKNSVIAMQTSTNGGKTWSSETIIYDDNYGEEIVAPGGGGKTQNGEYILFMTEQTDVHSDSTQISYLKSRNGLYNTQEERTPIPLINYEDWEYGAFVTAQMVYVPTVGLMQPIQLNMVKEYDRFHSFQIAFLWSFDDGETWELHYSPIIDAVNEVTEPSLVYLGGGKILGLPRTDGNDCEFLQVKSSNYGETWDQPEETGWKAKHPDGYGSMVKVEKYGDYLIAIVGNRQINEYEIKILYTDVAWDDAKAWRDTPVYSFDNSFGKVNNWIGYNSAVLLNIDTSPCLGIAYVLGANQGETGQRLMFTTLDLVKLNTEVRSGAND